MTINVGGKQENEEKKKVAGRRKKGEMIIRLILQIILVRVILEKTNKG